ncbi:MAG: XdhC family protein, partial [Armatimonadota bacterium]
MDKTVLETIVARHQAGSPFVVAALVRVRGSAPQRPGARLVVSPDGNTVGTIGGGCLEMEARRRALNLMGERRAERFELRLDDDFGWDDGLLCGGEATVLLDGDTARQSAMATDALRLLHDTIAGRGVRTHTNGDTVGTIDWVHVDPSRSDVIWDKESGTLTEPILPEPVLVVCGCGHVGAALVRLGAMLGFRTVAVDDRPEYANAIRLPEAAVVVCEDPARVAREWPTDGRTYWVVVTRGHRNDGRVLAGIVDRPSAY